MREHRFRARLLPEEGVTRTDQLLPPLVIEDGHFGHSQRHAMRQCAKSQAKWDSRISVISRTTSYLMCQTYLVVSHVIIRAHALNLHGAQHPADVVDNLDIFGGCL